jgi:hypothetical protein
MSLVAVAQSVDYLIVHAVLLAGRGAQIGVYRLPAVGVQLIGLVAVWAYGLNALVVVALAGLGYSISVAVMAAALLRSSAPAALTMESTSR